MQAIFVMVKCELGKAYEVAENVCDGIEEISEIYSISGPYDLMAKFYLEKGVDVGRFVCEKLQTLPHIKDTLTINTFKAFGLKSSRSS